MTTLSIEIPEFLAARLEAIAQGRNVSRENVVQEAITAYLVDDLEKPEARPRSFFEAAGDIIGSLEGPGDLTTNPAHMEGFGES